MLAVRARQSRTLQGLLIRPDFDVFPNRYHAQIPGRAYVAFICIDLQMIIATWLIKTTDCTHVSQPQDSQMSNHTTQVLQLDHGGAGPGQHNTAAAAAAAASRGGVFLLDIDHSVHCFKGWHTVRAALASFLLVSYVLTAAVFGLNYLENPTDKLDIRMLVKFSVVTNATKLLLVFVATLLTSNLLVTLVAPALGNAGLLLVTWWMRPSNIGWVNSLMAFGYAALTWHSVCILASYFVHDIASDNDAATAVPAVLHGLGIMALLLGGAQRVCCHVDNHSDEPIGILGDLDQTKLKHIRYKGHHAVEITDEDQLALVEQRARDDMADENA
jgi:hypothetical protein